MSRFSRGAAAALVATAVVLLGACSNADTPTGPAPLRCATPTASTAAVQAPSCVSLDLINPSG